MKSLIVALWAKLYPWKKKAKYQVNEDFHFLSSEEDDSITDIGILKGKYAGVVYQYGKAKIVEEGDFARLTSDYTIINSPSFDKKILQNDEEFVTIKEVAETCANLTGFNGEFIYVPDRPQEVKHATCSSDKARKLLGYKTMTNTKDGIRKTYEYIKDHGPRDFKYHLDVEIINDKTPKTWTKKLI